MLTVASSHDTVQHKALVGENFGGGFGRELAICQSFIRQML